MEDVEQDYFFFSIQRFLGPTTSIYNWVFFMQKKKYNGPRYLAEYLVLHIVHLEREGDVVANVQDNLPQASVA